MWLTFAALYRTLVNGIVITDRTQLRHGGRILLGNNHLFRLNCPGKEGEGASDGGRGGE